MIFLPIHKKDLQEEKRLILSAYQRMKKRRKLHNRVYTNWKAIANLDKHKCRLLIMN